MTQTALTLAQQIRQLNVVQQEAVEAPEAQHILVSAGAGTGKTRVLTLRYMHLVQMCHISPTALMAVTFTNKASHEMKERLGQFMNIAPLWIGTFHALGMRILRQHATLFHRTRDFRILDVSDQNTLIQKILKPKIHKKNITPRSVLAAISQWKHQFKEPDDILRPSVPLYLEIYREYHQQLRLMNSFDFDDLLFYSLRLMQDHPDIAQQYNFSYILVDEYQDINEMQYQWLKSFQGAHLFCVGDDDQSIYGWRGACVEKMIRFGDDFSEARLICLEDNYRSTPHILSAASHLIARNAMRHGKILRTQETEGEKIQIQGLWNSGEEAMFVAEHILRLSGQGHALKDMAILVRTSAQTREFEERFVLQNIPYLLVGGTGFYDRLEIRDMVAYLRVVHSLQDNLAFERIINTPKRGVGAVTLQNLYALVLERSISLEESARLFCQENTTQGLRPLSHLLSLIEHWRTQSTIVTLPQLLELILNESGYGAMWREQGIQGETRLENIKELIKALAPFSTLSEALEHISLLSDITRTSEERGISIMTIHAAKGLEFDTVFLPGWEEHIFPHIRAIEEGGQKGVEEERRLAYVALTRARKSATISFCWNRRGHQGVVPSSPSRFINELPQEHINLCLKFQTSASTSGQHVVHDIFGYGTIQGSVGPMVSVLFEKYGVKKILSRFLKFVTTRPNP